MASEASTPLFSVVIPAYGAPDFLEQAIRSVYAQSDRDFELVVVDDGSAAESEQRLQELQRELGFSLHRQSNSGAGVARNRGAELAHGEYLVFLDGDDLLLPWGLATYRRTLGDGGVSLMVGKFVTFTDPTMLPRNSSEAFQCLRYRDFLACSNDEAYVGAGQTIVKREIFLAAGGFPTERINCEDHDLILRLGTAEGFVRICEPATIGYRQHANSATLQWQKTYDGANFLIAGEKSGRYCGGQERQRERRRIIGKHVRPVSLACCRAGHRRAGWGIYCRTFWWHVFLGQWKYLLGFPVRALISRRGN